MSNQVYANGMEVSCKASGGKSIASFPDVCFTPPQTPATPPGVPIPYPNTAMASDTSDGSSTVKSGGQEIMLKDKSCFKQSTGDEAGAAPKKNVLTSKTKGKAYFIAWSMDVKAEGENVVRHLDLTTHNHGSKPAGAPPALHTALQAMGKIPDCADNVAAIESKCDPWEEKARCPEATEKKIRSSERARSAAKKTGNQRLYDQHNAKVRELYAQYAEEMEKIPCRQALRCVLVPYSKAKKVGCPKQTGDHLVEQATVNSLGDYNINAAPTAIVEGPSYHIGTHGMGHELRTQGASKTRGKFDLAKSAKLGASKHKQLFPGAECNQECLKQQLVSGHTAMGIDSGDKVDKPTLNSEHNRELLADWMKK